MVNGESKVKQMLEHQDIKMIENVMRTVIKENNQELEKHLDEKMTKNNQELEKRLDEKMTKNNQELEKRLEKRLDKKLEERLTKNNQELMEQFDKKLEEKITNSETFLLEEMERYHKASMKEIKKLDDKLDEVTQFYRIKKLEDDTSGYLLQLYHKQQHEIDEIKMVIGL